MSPTPATTTARMALRSTLHRVLHGTEHLDPERVWRAVAANSQALRVAGVEMEIPGVRSAHLAPRAAPRGHDDYEAQAWGDLQRAINGLEPQTWTPTQLP